MKLNIIKGYDKQTKKDIVLGWNFTAENVEEEKNLSLIRNLLFFGIKDYSSYPQYSGRTDNPKTKLVHKIWYNIPQHTEGITNGTIHITPEDPEAHSMLKDWNA